MYAYRQLQPTFFFSDNTHAFAISTKIMISTQISYVVIVLKLVILAFQSNQITKLINQEIASTTSFIQ